MKLNNIVYSVFVLLVLISCGEGNEKVLMTPSEEEPKQKIIQREIDPKIYSYGQQLYLKNCAVCHGKNAEGGENWQKLNEDGKYPPPPLNGTGHTWHHSTKALTNVIKNGTGKIGGNMPAWKDKLKNKDIEAILVFIQAQWPDELYTAWYNNFHKKQ